MTASEAARVRVVEALGVMGSAPTPEFDRLARLVGHVADASYAHVCFLDGTHQYIKALEGAEVPRLLPREESICVEVVGTQSPLIIRDFKTDHRRPCRDLHERHGFSSYVGVPIRLSNDHVIGAVAAISRDDISLSDRQMAALHECADLAGRETLIKRSGPKAKPTGGDLADDARAQDALRAVMTSHIRVFGAVSDGIIVVRADGTIKFANAAAERMLGRPAGSLRDASFQDEVFYPEGGGKPANAASPVLASLADGTERLVRSAPFRRKQGDAVRVGYAVSPILADARVIGAAVVFRALEKGEFSNGVDLRGTLREVAKLKEKLARVEAAQRSIAAMPPRPLPPLSARPVDFAALIEAIREERADQSMRSSGASEERSDGLYVPRPSLIRGPEWAMPRLAPRPGRSLSRTERWLASDPNY